MNYRGVNQTPTRGSDSLSAVLPVGALSADDVSCDGPGLHGDAPGANTRFEGSLAKRFTYTAGTPSCGQRTRILHRRPTARAEQWSRPTLRRHILLKSGTTSERNNNEVWMEAGALSGRNRSLLDLGVRFLLSDSCCGGASGRKPGGRRIPLVREPTDLANDVYDTARLDHPCCRYHS